MLSFLFVGLLSKCSGSIHKERKERYCANLNYISIPSWVFIFTSSYLCKHYPTSRLMLPNTRSFLKHQISLRLNSICIKKDFSEWEATTPKFSEGRIGAKRNRSWIELVTETWNAKLQSGSGTKKRTKREIQLSDHAWQTRLRTKADDESIKQYDTLPLLVSSRDTWKGNKSNMKRYDALERCGRENVMTKASHEKQNKHRSVYKGECKIDMHRAERYKQTTH